MMLDILQGMCSSVCCQLWACSVPASWGTQSWQAFSSNTNSQHTSLSGLRPHQLTSLVSMPAALRAGAETSNLQLLQVNHTRATCCFIEDILKNLTTKYTFLALWPGLQDFPTAG